MLAANLYIWRPRGVGNQLTVMVVDTDLDQAKKVADAFVAQAIESDKWGKYKYWGWGSDDYLPVEIHPQGQAVVF